MVRLRGRVLVSMVVVVALALSLIGCGGGGTAETNDGRTVVKLGVGAPITAGAVAVGNGMVRSAKLAVKLANESQESNDLGIRFELVEADDQGDPKTGVNAANTLVSDRAVVGIIGHLNSGVAIPASEVYQRAGIVTVSPSATSPQFTARGMDNTFRTCADDSVQGPRAAEMAYQDLGFRTVFVVDDSTPYGTGLGKEFGKKFSELGGTVIRTEKTSDKETDFSSLVTKIKVENVDFVFYGGAYPAGALLSRQLSDNGVTAPMMGGDHMYDAEFITLAGTAAEGDLTTNIGAPVDLLPGAAQFLDWWKAEYPNDEIAAYDALTFDAANAIINAVYKVATESGVQSLFSPEGKAGVIAGVAASDFEGVTGPVSFDEKGDTNNKTVTLYTVANGEWVPWEK